MCMTFLKWIQKFKHFKRLFITFTHIGICCEHIATKGPKINIGEITLEKKERHGKSVGKRIEGVEETVSDTTESMKVKLAGALCSCSHWYCKRVLMAVCTRGLRFANYRKHTSLSVVHGSHLLSRSTSTNFKTEGADDGLTITAQG